MQNYEIYLAGGMGNLSFKEQNEWRALLKNMLEKTYSLYKVICWNPVDYYNFVTKSHDSEREIMEFDLNKVRNARLVIVNFNDPASLGTMAEIAIAYEKKIPVVGICADKEKLHPWQVEMCSKILDDIYELVLYVAGFYLI